MASHFFIARPFCLSTYVAKYIHTYIHKYIHICIYTCIHTYMHTYVRTYTCIHAHKHTCIHTYIHTYIHTTLSHLRSKEITSIHKPCIPHSTDSRATTNNVNWFTFRCSWESGYFDLRLKSLIMIDHNLELCDNNDKSIIVIITIIAITIMTMCIIAIMLLYILVHLMCYS